MIYSIIQENKHNHHSYKTFTTNIVVKKTVSSKTFNKNNNHQTKNLQKKTSNIVPSSIKLIEKIQFISDLLHDLSYNFIQNYSLSDRIGKSYLCVDTDDDEDEDDGDHEYDDVDDHNHDGGYDEDEDDDNDDDDDCSDGDNDDYDDYDDDYYDIMVWIDNNIITATKRNGNNN